MYLEEQDYLFHLRLSYIILLPVYFSGGGDRMSSDSIEIGGHQISFQLLSRMVLNKRKDKASIYSVEVINEHKFIQKLIFNVNFNAFYDSLIFIK